MPGLADVGEFVDEDVVEQGHRKLHGCPVDVEPVVLAEGAPPVAEIADVEVTGCTPMGSAQAGSAEGAMPEHVAGTSGSSPRCPGRPRRWHAASGAGRDRVSRRCQAGRR